MELAQVNAVIGDYHVSNTRWEPIIHTRTTALSRKISDNSHPLLSFSGGELYHLTASKCLMRPRLQGLSHEAETVLPVLAGRTSQGGMTQENN